jgi:tight adherence protein C
VIMLLKALTLAALALAVVAAISIVRRPETPEPDLRGLAATRRREELSRSALLRALWPLVRVMTDFVRALPPGAWRASLNAKLIYAGQPVGMDADEFVAYNASLVGLTVVVALVVVGLYDAPPAPLVGLVVLVTVLPYLQLLQLIEQRRVAVTRGLPQALDLVVMAMRAGSDFVGALATVLAGWSDKRDPLHEELARVLTDLQLGQTRSAALEAFARRVPAEMVKAFVGSAIEAEQRGTPLADVIATQAEVARTMRFLAAEGVAERNSVIANLPMTLMFVAAAIVIMGALVLKVRNGLGTTMVPR